MKVVRVTGQGFTNIEEEQMSDNSISPKRTSDISKIRGRLGRTIVPVIFEAENEDEEDIVIEMMVLRPGELVVGVGTAFGKVSMDLASQLDSEDLSKEEMSPLVLEKFNERGATQMLKDFEDYQVEIISVAVVDKDITKDIIAGFDREVITVLYQTAMGGAGSDALNPSTVDTFLAGNPKSGDEE